MARRWNEEEEHLLRLLIPTNSWNEIAEEFRRRRTKLLPGFKAERTAEAIRRKCGRDNLTKDSVRNYSDPYKTRWDYIKELTKEYKMASEREDTGLIENANKKILSLSDILGASATAHNIAIF